MKNIPAFPLITPDMPVNGHPGMTLLDYFAARVKDDGGINEWEHEEMAKFKYERAAAMVKEREKYIILQENKSLLYPNNKLYY